MLDLLPDGARAAVVVNADDYKDADLRAASVERELDDLRGWGFSPSRWTRADTSTVRRRCVRCLRTPT
jgi:hypothetical protein